MKYSRRNFSKKKMFPGAERKTNIEGRRVWVIGGKEYPTLRTALYQISEEIAKSRKEKSEKPLTKKA